MGRLFTLAAKWAERGVTCGSLRSEGAGAAHRHFIHSRSRGDRVVEYVLRCAVKSRGCVRRSLRMHC